MCLTDSSHMLEVEVLLCEEGLCLDACKHLRVNPHQGHEAVELLVKFRAIVLQYKSKGAPVPVWT